MKKSWHPLLMKNQERVWLEEKKALEEKKKLDQLRKEKEEERQLQELQRLQEEQTGKKRTEKLEWMYSTPATGSSTNPNDLEDYLLGKKRVDKMLTADEHAKLGASHKNFIAVQNANNARDIAAKIREDPLLAIKQQEQAAYQALLSNPLRLREMQERAGMKVKDKKDKKDRKREKEEKKRRKEERRRHRDSRSRSPDTRHRSRHSRSPDVRMRLRSPDDRRERDYPARRDYYDRRSRSRSPDRGDSKHHSLPSRLPPSYDRPSDRSSSPEPPRRGDRDRRRSRSPPRYDDYKPRQDDSFSKRPRSRSPRRGPERDEPYPKRSRIERPPIPSRPPPPPSNQPKPDDRAARLAAMQSDASTMSVDRKERLAQLLEKEKAELEADDRARKESKGMSSYLSMEQKRVFGGTGGLEDRIRRGRGGMVVDAD